MALPVKARQNAPPSNPAIGDRYLIGAAPTGAWSGHADKFATWQTSFWSLRNPVKGDETYLQDTDEWIFYDGTAWGQHPLASPNASASTYLAPGSLGSFLARSNIDWGNQGTGDDAVIETIVNTGARPYWNWRITHPGSGGDTMPLQTRREWDLAGGALASGEFVEIATVPQGLSSVNNRVSLYLRNPSTNVAVRVLEDTGISVFQFQRLTGFDLINNGTIANTVGYSYIRRQRNPLNFFRLRRDGSDIQAWTSADGEIFALRGAINFGSDAAGFTRVGVQLARGTNSHCSVTWLKLTRGQ